MISNLRTNLQGVVQDRVPIELHPSVLLSPHVHLELCLLLFLKRPDEEDFKIVAAFKSDLL